MSEESEKEKQAVESIRDRLRKRNACSRCGSRPCDLAISRVPKTTLIWFREQFATKEDFCQDWGMAFKSLCDGHVRLQHYEGNLVDTESVLEMVNQLKSELDLLKQQLAQPQKEEVKHRTMLDGRTIRKRG